MMSKAERKQLYSTIEKRILAGERKSKIYAEYTDEQDSKLAARLLALIPTPMRRKQFTLLNWILIVCLGILTFIKIIVFALFVLNEFPEGALFILIVPVINIYMMWLVAKFRGIGYLLVIVLGMNGLFSIMEEFEAEIIYPSDFAVIAVSIVLVITSIVISFVLMNKLLPQTNFCLTPKKDKTGRPIFEE